MIKDLKNPNVLLSIVSILLAVVIIAVQFIPCWTFMQREIDPVKIKETGKMEYEKTASMADFMWYPKYNSGVLDQANREILDIDAQLEINDIAFPVMLQFAFALATIIACIAKPKQSVFGLLTVVCGASGLIGYLMLGALFAGCQGVWITNIILSAVMLILGVVKVLSKSIFKKAFA